MSWLGHSAMDELLAKVAQAYDSGVEREWNRLARSPYRALEFDLTWDALLAYLPACARVLDA
ncbi:MAG: hypothetical protein HY835_00795, partial [Anaerolineae bacterium]|nr:hypothetical protein [Anaerolineae bacterium]